MLYNTLEFTPILRVKFVKSINNLIQRKWAQIDAVKEEDYHNDEAEDSCFVMAVTFLNIIYLLKNDGK